MVHRSALGGDSLTSRPGGGGGGGGLASRMQSRLQSRFQMSGQSFLSPSKQQQQQQEVGIVSQLETKRSSSGLLSHLNFLDHEGDFGSEEDGEEGGGKGVERVKSEAAANTRPSSSFPDKNNSMGSGNGGNILYQTMFMSLPKIESPKVRIKRSALKRFPPLLNPKTNFPSPPLPSFSCLY